MTGLASTPPRRGAQSGKSSTSAGGGGKTPPGPAAASTAKRRARQPAVSYESFAPRSAEQRSRLARIAALTAGPCFSAGEERKVDDDGDGYTLVEAMCPPKSASADPGTAGGPSSLVDPSVLATLALTSSACDALTTSIRNAASLRLALQASLNIAEDVSRRHAELLKHSGELSAAAERLQAEEAVLTARAEEIGRPLEHYDAVDRSGVLVGVLFKDGGRSVVRGPTRLNVNDDRERYVAVLEQIDAAVDFFGGDGGGVEVFGRPGSAGGSAGGGMGGGRGGRGGTRYAAAQPYDPRVGGSAEYYRRACALQDAALELLRVGVADRISQTSSQVQDTLNLPRVPIAADKLEASLVYTRFHGISRRSNALLSVAKERLDALGQGSVASSSYEDLMSLCRGAYCSAREALLTSTVRMHMDTLRERHGLVGMTRLASVFLIRLCNVETALYLDFFGDPSKRQQSRRKLSSGAADDGGNDEGQAAVGSPAIRRLGSAASQSASTSRSALSDDPAFRDAEFQSCLGSLCSALHRTVRRGLVSVLDLDVLCQVVSVLREERAAANASPVTTAAARAVSGVIQDAQERLIFCANSSLHREVVKFRPGKEDLDYPGKLLPPGEKGSAAGAIVVDDGDGGEGASEGEAKAPDGPTDDAEAKPSQTTGGVDDAVAAQLKVYESWFPPMRSVLRILSKIFRVVEPRVFEDIALSAVQSCTKSLKDGSVQIYRSSGLVHADLFLVKHLLVSFSRVRYGPVWSLMPGN